LEMIGSIYLIRELFVIVPKEFTLEDAILKDTITHYP